MQLTGIREGDIVEVDKKGRAMPTTARVDYLCWNDACLGIGRWSVILGVDGEPLDDADGDCPSCGEPGEADPDA